MCDFAKLREPFAADELEWRLQQAGETNSRIWAICVPYVTNRAIQTRLDEVVGPAFWRNEYRQGPDGGVICGISLYLADGMDGLHWVTKWDGAPNTDKGGGDTEMAIKGGLSAAMKRAAVQWGIGRYLYAIEDTFAVVAENGRLRGKTKSGTQFKWDPPRLPSWALPANGATDEQRSELLMAGEALGTEAAAYVDTLLSGPLTHDTADKELRKLRKRLEKASAV